MKALKLAACLVAIILAGLVIGEAQISIPYSFTPGTTILSNSVNSNFNTLGGNALNRTGGTMTGTLTSQAIVPVADGTYNAGSSSFRFLSIYAIGTYFNNIAYTWPSSQTASTFLKTNGSGTLTWAAVTIPPASIANCGLRLTLTSGTPVTTSDVTAATSVFVSPIVGGECSFYDGASTWTSLTNSEVTISVAATTATIYDVWCRNNSGTIACDTTAWTNDTTRATALAKQNNVYVKTGDTTRRYIGSFRTTGVSGQTEDSLAKRYVWSYYNRARRPVKVTESANSWAYSSATWRQFNNSAANQADVVIGWNEVLVALRGMANVDNSGTGNFMGIAVGQDSATTPMAGSIGSVSVVGTASSNNQALVTCFVEVMPAVGRHFYALLEADISGAGTGTFYGDNGGTNMNSGIFGWIEG